MLTDRIHALEERHDALKSTIASEYAHPYRDEMRIARLKHEKLSLKDKISKLQHMAEQKER